MTKQEMEEMIKVIGDEEIVKIELRLTFKKKKIKNLNFVMEPNEMYLVNNTPSPLGDMSYVPPMLEFNIKAYIRKLNGKRIRTKN